MLSLAANGVLGITLFQEHPARLDDDGASLTLTPNTSPVLSSRIVPLDDKAWATLEAGSNEDFVAHLRAQGFPPEALRRLLSLRLQKSFSERRKALFAHQKPYEYWKFYYSSQPDLDAGTRSKLRELAYEHSKLMSQLLGDDASPDLTADQRRIYGDLSAEKIQKVETIFKDYEELTARTRDEMRGILLPEDREKLNFLEKEKQRDLVNVLTSQELEEFNLRSSESASVLKSRLAEFQPSEKEYRTLFKLQEAFDAQYGTRDLTPKETRRRDEAMPKLLAEIRTVLGSERFAEYEVKTDPAYNSNQFFVVGSGLPAEMTDRLVNVQREMTQRATALKDDESLTPEQRYAQLTALAEEATAKTSATLGSEAFDRYKKSAGQWLTRLRPAVPGTKSR